MSQGALAHKEESENQPAWVERSPLRVAGKSSRETAMNAFGRFMKEIHAQRDAIRKIEQEKGQTLNEADRKQKLAEIKYHRHSNEFKEELKTAPKVEIKGFTPPNRMEKYRILKEKTEAYDKEVSKLERLRQINASDEDIEDQQKELDKLTREMFQTSAEARLGAEDPFLDDDEIRLLIKRVIPAHLRAFFEEHCKIEYDPDLKDDELKVADTGKIVFRFGPGLLMTEKQGGKQVPRVDKVMFQLGRMVGALLHEPTAWKEYTRSVRVLEQRAPEWKDFVALYLTDPTECQRLAPEGYNAVKKVFENLKTATGSDDLRKRLNTDTRTEKLDTKFEFAGNNYIGLWGRSIKFMQKISAFREEASERMLMALRELVPYKQTDWYERTLVEFEDKEVSKVLARDEHVTDRHKRLKTFFENHDEFGARTLIKSMAHTGDSRWWVYHMFLYQFDPLYRKTNGEEITLEKYSFIVQCLRISHVGKRHGTKPGEYAPIQARIAGGRRRIKRVSREVWEEAALDEIDKRSMRDLLAVAQEAYEWMECERADGTRGQFEIDETFGNPDDEPFKLKGWQGHRDQYQEETNNFLNLMDKDFVEQVSQTANFHRSKEDKSQGWFKLDPDQVLMIARLVAMSQLINNPKLEYHGIKYKVGTSGDIRDPFSSEHFKLAQKRAVDHYSKQAEEYEAHKAKGGTPIPAYDRFLHHIHFFKEKELAAVKQRQEAAKYDADAEAANEIVAKNPIVSAEDDPEETAKKLATVEHGEANLREKLVEGGNDKKDGIEQLAINAELKRIIKKNPQEIKRLLLDDPDDLHTLTDTIFKLQRPTVANPQDEPAYTNAHNRHYQKLFQDFAKIRTFYEQKRVLLNVMWDLEDWLADIKPIKTKLPEPENNADAEAIRIEHLKNVRGEVEQALKKFTPIQKEDKPMPRFDYHYKDETGQTKRELTDQEYLDIKKKFKYLDEVPESQWEETDLWRQCATKRERRVLNVRVSPTQTMPMIVGHPPEYEMGQEDRPKWLYYQLRLFQAALINELTEKPAPPTPAPATPPPAPAP
ncbi:MAG: hypothetical protein WAP74_02815 [Patescibacteria group bacterium]